MLAFDAAFILYFIQGRIKWHLCTSIMYQDAIATKICKLFDFFYGKNTFLREKHRYHDFIFLLFKRKNESNGINQAQIHKV